MAKKKGIKISKIKRANHIRNKLAKRGKLKTNQKKPTKFYGQIPQNTRPPQTNNNDDDDNGDYDVGEEMLGMVDNDDVEFLQNAVTSQSYQILKQLRIPSQNNRENWKRTQGHKDDDNDKMERMYEQMNQSDIKRTKLLLPIKTKEGLIMRTTEIDEQEEERQKLQREIREKEKEEERRRKKREKKQKQKDKKELSGEVEEKEGEMKNEEDDGDNDDSDESDDAHYYDDNDGDEEEDMNMLMKEELENAHPVSSVDLMACREELVRKRKFQIGVLASGLLEEPEMKVRNFKFLLEILNTEHSEVKLTIRKLAALSLLEVFKDLLPSYQIKHQEVNPRFKLKKTTERLHTYEKSLLKAYKTYLQILDKMSKVHRRLRGDSRPRDETRLRLGEVAVRCMAELLVRHPYFNFSPNIAQALVHFVDNSNSTIRQLAANGLRTVLKEDKRGEISLSIVRRINFLVKKKNHAVHPEVLSVLLALNLRDINLDAEKEAELKEKKLKTHKQRLLNLSKRERKRKKRLEEIEQEMLETKAEENKQYKHKNLTEVTKSVFTIFFRVLKCAPSSKLLRVTLEGLAKFALCINLEFFQDLVNVLDQLLREGKLGHVEQLYCVETVFTILSGQGEALNIDPLRFYAHLYCSLPEIHAGCTNGDGIIVLRALEKAVIGRRRKMSLQRLMAFIKRLCTLAPHLLHGVAMGYLAVIRNIMIQTKACDVLLDTDSSHGEGIYQPEMPEPEYCGAGCSVLWELVLLKRHYHPVVREMAQSILKGDESILPSEITKVSPSNLAEMYDGSKMAFRPAVPPPPKANPRQRHGRLVFNDDEFAQYLQNVEQSVNVEALKNWHVSGLQASDNAVTGENV